MSWNWQFLVIVAAFGVGLICGIWARNVAEKKGRYPLGWFLIGFFTAFLGVIIVYLLPVSHHFVREKPMEIKQTVKPSKPIKGPLLKRCIHCGASIPVDAKVCGICKEMQE